MEFSFGKLWLAAGSALLGAILGASFAGWRATAAATGRSTGATGDEMDSVLNQASPHAFGSSATVVIQGAIIGGIIGLVVMIGILVLMNIERVRDIPELDDPER